MINIHASCVVLNNKGILILGKSGSGKSDLVLRLIEQTGAVLVADDRTLIEQENNEIIASCVDNIKGLLEVRGIGIIRKNYQQKTTLKLVVELVDDISKIIRLPEKEYWQYEQVKIKKIKIYPFETSAPYKIKSACDEIRDES